MYVNRCSGVNCHYVNKTADYETNVSRSLSPCIVMTTTITIDVTRLMNGGESLITKLFASYIIPPFV